MKIKHRHSFYVAMTLLSNWICRHSAKFQDYTFAFELRRMSCWNFATTKTFIKKNNWYILECKAVVLWLWNTSFVWRFYNADLYKCRCSQFKREVKVLWTLSTFPHQFALENFSSNLNLFVLGHLSVALSRLFLHCCAPLRHFKCSV